MAAPILTQVPWSKGRYDSFVLHHDGTLIDTIQPPDFAWLVDKNEEYDAPFPNYIMFLSSSIRQGISTTGA
jgi:hypothetical protein